MSSTDTKQLFLIPFHVPTCCAGAAFNLGPVSHTARGTGPALVSPRPPLPPGAPRRRELTDEPSEGPDTATSGSGRRLSASGPLPPTPPTNRRSSGSAGVERGGSFGRRMSGGLEPEGSLESYGSYGRRRVRVSGGGEEGDLASELSVEGSELSATSAASLSMYAPGGVRPPALAGGAFAVDYLGTSRKRVSWAEYADVSAQAGYGEGQDEWGRPVAGCLHVYSAACVD